MRISCILSFNYFFFKQFHHVAHFETEQQESEGPKTFKGEEPRLLSSTAQLIKQNLEIFDSKWQKKTNYSILICIHSSGYDCFGTICILPQNLSIIP